MSSTQKRQRFLIDTANEDGFVSISDAAVHLNVSVETIRRDINKLSAAGKLTKERGGASPAKPSILRDEEQFGRNRNISNEKKAIGAVAAMMIKDGNVIGIDTGFAAEALANAIKDVHDVTFVTKSINVALILARKISAGEISGNAVLLGGETDFKNRFTKGTYVIDAVDRFSFDLVFVGCTAVSEEGVSDYDIDDSCYAHHLISRAVSSVLIVESVKFGKDSVYRFAEIKDFNIIITDDKKSIHGEIIKKAENAEVKIITVAADFGK